MIVDPAPYIITIVRTKLNIHSLQELLEKVEGARKAGRTFVCLLDNGNPQVGSELKLKFGGRTGSYFEDNTDSEDEP